MRNRDMPAFPVEAHEEVRWEADPPGGNLKSERHDMKTGLTKREAGAFAAMQGMVGASPARLDLQILAAREVGISVEQHIAAKSVEQTDALFDHLEGIVAADPKATFAEAYRALVDIRDAGRTAETQTDASVRAQAALTAIAEMSPPPQGRRDGHGPTPEAGYQSLLRETAGERLGATKPSDGN